VVKVEALYHIRSRGWVAIVPNCYPHVAAGTIVRSIYSGHMWNVLGIDHHVPLGGRAIGAEMGWNEGLLLGEGAPPSINDELELVQ
jgi:hypothetical protein